MMEELEGRDQGEEACPTKNVDVMASIFSFMLEDGLSSCAQTCKTWNACITSPMFFWLWESSYKRICEVEVLVERKEAEPNGRIPYVDYRSKSKDLLHLIRQQAPYRIEELLPSAESKKHLLSRAGHSANVLLVDSRSSMISSGSSSGAVDVEETKEMECLLLFGGASHLFTFSNTADLVDIGSGQVLAKDMRLQCPITGSPFLPSKRWLHTACNVVVDGASRQQQVFVFGGQCENGEFENDSLLISVSQQRRHKDLGNEQAAATTAKACDGRGRSLQVYARRIVPLDTAPPSRRGGHTMVALDDEVEEEEVKEEEEEEEEIAKLHTTSANKFVLFGGMMTDARTEEKMCLNDVYMATLFATSSSEGGVGTSQSGGGGGGCSVEKVDSASLSSSAALSVKLSWTKIECKGALPAPRWCHSARIVPKTNDMVIFGGWLWCQTRAAAEGNGQEQGQGQDQESVVNHIFLNDLHVLDTTCFAWSSLQTSGIPPSPRSQAAMFTIACNSMPSCVASSSVSPLQLRKHNGAFLLIYGGACHSTETEASDTPYGNRVVDLHNFKMLDLETGVWLPLNQSFPQCRGGVNAIQKCSRGWLLSGGMHSDAGAVMPRFKSDLVLIHTNLERTAGGAEDVRKQGGDSGGGESSNTSSSKIFNARV